MTKIISLILIAFALGACQSSPPKEYFALSANAANFSSSENNAVNYVVGIGPIVIPEYLQHSKISYWKTSQHLTLLNNHYWAEPLERGITRVLALELQAAHTDWRVVQYPWPTNLRPSFALRVDVLRFDAFKDHALLEATVDWIDLQTKKVLGSQTIKMRQDSSASPDAIAQAFSELLQKTALAIKPFPARRGS